MKIGIIGAMKVETDGLKAAMTDTETQKYSGIEYVSGKINGTDVVAAMSGVGKVFAAVCAQTMILKFGVELIVNIGVAGTLTDKLDMLDVAVAESVIQHDMDTSAVGDPVGMISGINIINIPADKKASALLADCAKKIGRKALSGAIASGDQFVDAGKKEEINAKFTAIAAEMESGGVSQVCYINSVPFAVLRAISDGCSQNAMDYSEFRDIAAADAIKIVLSFIARADEL